MLFESYFDHRYDNKVSIKYVEGGAGGVNNVTDISLRVSIVVIRVSTKQNNWNKIYTI